MRMQMLDMDSFVVRIVMLPGALPRISDDAKAILCLIFRQAFSCLDVIDVLSSGNIF
jgi:hypothetical protein